MSAPPSPLTHSQRLRAATHAIHEALDQSLMAAQPFLSRDRYLRFLRMQYRFHHDIDPLFSHPGLANVVPDLAGRRRLERIIEDFADLGRAPPTPGAHPMPSFADLPTALGWFYVAEGSNLGAAILSRQAAELGLDDTCGARHLAGHPDGRARHWRSFTSALDALPLGPAEEDRLADGARAAFVRVQQYAQQAFAD